MAICTHVDEIRDVTPEAPGCIECLATGDTWTLLRVCLSCGHVGCCDTSKNKHATKHFHATDHAIARLTEYVAEVGWCYADQLYLDTTAKRVLDERERTHLS